MAGLGQRGAAPLTGSVDKLIDFISVSHATPNLHWLDIHMFTVQRIIVLSLFSLFLFLSHHISHVSHLSFFRCVLSTSLSLFISLFLHSISLSPPFGREHFKFSLRARLGVGAPLKGGCWVCDGALVFSAIPLDEALEQGE